MRSIPYLLCWAVVAIACSPGASATFQAATNARLEALLASEFAFQSGQFSQAFDFYRARPPAEFCPQERFRGGQLAILLADQKWQQALLNQPIAHNAALAERTQQFALALRYQQAKTAQSVWQQLLTVHAEAGAEQANAVLGVQTNAQRPFLHSVLQSYAAQPALSPFERVELAYVANQWEQALLTKQLVQPLDLAKPENSMAAVLVDCQAAASVACLQRLQLAEPVEFSEPNRRRLLQWAQKQGDKPQQWRWWQALPQDGNTYYQRILLLSEAMSAEKASTLMAEVQKDAQLSPFQRVALQGSLAELQQDWPAAEAHYRAAIALESPTSAAIRLPVVLLRQNKREQALALLRDVAGQAEYSDEIRRDAVLIELQVLTMLPGNRQNPMEFVAAYRRALAFWPQAQSLRYALAMRHFQQNQTAQAMAELKRLLAEAPANADALNAYGFTLAKELNKPRQAFEPLQKAYLLEPERPEILDSYGYVLHRVGRHQEALVPLQKAWQATPSATTAGHLAQVYWQLGQRQQAQDYLSKGLQLDAREAELLKLQEQWR